MPEPAQVWRRPALTGGARVPSKRRRSLAAAAVAFAATGALAWFGLPVLIHDVPHVPERFPAPIQAWLAQHQPEPDWTALPLGPALREAQRRGELVVAVRAYARPAPPGVPTPLGPDSFDADLARTLAQHLQLRLRLIGVPADGHLPDDAPVDLVRAGAGAAPAAWQPVPTAYTGGQGALVVLRNTVYRTTDDLHGRSVCVPQGSPYAAALVARHGAVPQAYPSAIRAIWAFLSGDCQALADDERVLERLVRLPEWRFYRTLEQGVAPDNGQAQIALRSPDPVSAAYLDQAVRFWKTSGALARAREQRAGDIVFEVAQLQDGLVCHN
ncbi:ABC transporter substrate-binding protein [Ralstonia insidiosa]|nr:ABC transporter substrate-binding protein [Ralstonia insidiosa]